MHAWQPSGISKRNDKATPVIQKSSDCSESIMNDRGLLSLLAGLVVAACVSTAEGAIRSVTTLAATNLQVPGFPSGVQFQHFVTSIADETFNGPAINQSSQTTFFSTVAGPGITSANDLVLWSSGTGALHPVAQEGSPAPGTPAGVTFQTFGLPVISSTGETAFTAMLSGSGVDTSNNQGIWLERNGQLQLVARKGSQALGAASGVNYGAFLILN